MLVVNPEIVVAIATGLGVWLYIRWRSPRPEFPPLNTSPDDPLMIDALSKAKASLPDFLKFLKEPYENALVKLYFLSNTNQVEHLWAEVQSVVSDTELDILLVTPPVSHSGPLDRRYICKLDDIEDWQVRDMSGKVHGGFSQRAMFAIARRDGVKLPKKLLAQEREYEGG
jgi:uncharacterized protein YegJ (DUF2314 family)